MASGSCTKQNMLAVFADNSAQLISAADMRLLVNCVYDNFLDLAFVIDNLETYEPKQALSANQGAILNDSIEQGSILIQNLEADKADKNDVYLKSESDARYYSRDYIDSTFYDKTQVYTRDDVNDMVSQLQQNILALNDRIDNIVQKNNLIE